MSIKITDDCINCGACEPECPNNAIYEGSKNWKFSDGTKIKKDNIYYNGKLIHKDDPQKSQQEDIYFIVSDKCTECVGFFEEPQCAAVCPVECCIKDENCIESKDILLSKKNFLHSSK